MDCISALYPFVVVERSVAIELVFYGQQLQISALLACYLILQNEPSQLNLSSGLRRPIHHTELRNWQQLLLLSHLIE